MTATIHALKPMVQLRCEGCGTLADAACGCGVGYLPVKGIDPLLNTVQIANKFILDEHFLAAADALVGDDTQWSRLLPTLRLPFPVCWFEFDPANVPSFAALRTRSTEIIKRIGFLVEAADDSLTSFCAHIAIGRSEAPTLPLISYDRWNSGKISDFAEFMREDNPVDHPPAYEYVVKNIVLTEWGEALIDRLQREGMPTTDVETLCRGSLRLWDGAFKWLPGILCLLNVKNVARTEFIDKTTINRSRRRVGRPPFSSHYILTIRQQLREALSVDEGATFSQVRAHFVRGHYKVRKTGSFFWHPHLRGSLERGFVAKDYAVTA